MQQIYPLFYTKNGTRRLNHLQTPLLVDMDGFSRASILHYVGHAGTEILDATQPYFRGYTNRIQVDYPEDLFEPMGTPRKGVVQIPSLVRDFHQLHKNFQYRKGALQLVTDAQTLTVLNYALIEKIYRYATTPLTAYQKWFNIHRTIFTNIESACAVVSKYHFIEITVPELTPSVQMLRSFSTKPVTTNTVKVLSTPAHWWLLELWKWLDPELRETSILSKVSVNNYSKVTLLFKTPDSRYAILNLAYLNSWIKDQPNQTEFPKVQTLKPDMLQKLFLFFCMNLKKNLLQEESTLSGSPESTSTLTELEKDPDHNEEDTLSHDGTPEEHEDADMSDEVGGDIPVSMASKKKQAVDTGLKSMQEIEAKDVFAESSTDFLKQLSDMDEDLKALEVINRKKLQDSGLKVDGTEIEDDAQESTVDTITEQELQDIVYKDQGVYGILSHRIDQAAEVGILSVADMRKLQKVVEAQPLSKDPYGSEKTLEQASTLNKEDLLITPENSEMIVSPLVVDPSMRQSSLQSFDSHYIRKNMRKEILRCVTGLQRSGVIVRKHVVEEDHSAMGSFELHTFELKPIDGQPSTVRAKIPIVDEEGVFVASNSRYQMRKQIVDLPIRKINPTTVNLTSYIGKIAIGRSSRKSNSSLEYVLKQLNAASISDNPVIKDVAPADVFDTEFAAPYVYNGLAHSFKSFNVGDTHYVFDHTERENIATPEQIKKTEIDNKRICGKNSKGELVVVDNSDHFFLIEKSGAQKPLGDIFDILNLNRLAAPVDFAEMQLFSKSIPIGLALGYSMGFRRLIKFLKARFRTVDGRKQKNLEPYEYAIQFQDKSYIFDRRDKTASLIIAGFGEFDKFLKTRPSTDMDHRSIYVEMMETKGMGSLYVRELDFRDQVFIDPITRDTLEGMKEPTTLKGLMVRSCELLQTYHHPLSQDYDAQRTRGYERFAGAIYKSLAMSIRQFKNKNIANKSKVEMSPYEVWNTILKDPAVKIVEDINPIQNVKAAEIVTYVGEGGRGKDSMNKASRAYHKSDLGVVSESTVDSGDVGINFYLSGNPQFQDQRGIKRPEVKIEPSSLFSVSALISPSCDRDDPRRVAFVTHQSSHTVASVGYAQPRFRTGYEYVIGQRTGSMFCAAAKDAGKVISIDEHGILLEYKDGTKKGYALGRQYGKAEGSVYPHDVITRMKVGQSFKKGDIVSFNTGFFEPDIIDPNAVVYKGSLTATTVFYETSQTLEDSSAISTAFAKRMSTFTTKIKSYTVDFKQNIRNLVKVGQTVEPNTFLMLIEDEITSNSNAFDESSLELLSSLSKSAPRAGYLGTVDKIEVFYHGDKMDMSSTLRAISDTSDKLCQKERKAIGAPVYTGFVTDDYRVEGTPLAMDRAEIRIYITVGNGTSTGDKLVFSNQLKSTIGEVMDYTMTTEDGRVIEAIFGFRSNAARIVSSAMEISTTTTLLKVLDDRAVALYDA